MRKVDSVKYVGRFPSSSFFIPHPQRMTWEPLPTLRQIAMRSKLKVAVFNTQPPHLYFGGVERRIVEIAKRLTDVVDTEVYSGTKKGFSEVTEVDGTTFIPCFSTDMLYPLDNWVFNRTISKMVDAINADVYEAHTVSGYKFLKALNKRNISKPLIQTIHGVLADEYNQSSKSSSPSLRMKLSKTFMKYLAGIEKEAARKATLIVTVSKYSAEKIVQLYDVDEAKIRVVPNGVDSQRFKPEVDCRELKQKIGENSKHLILFVGNLIPRKGLQFLIEAAKQVLKENKDTKFVVVGDGPLKNRLISHSEEQGVSDKFAFLGNVPEAMLHQLYNCADVFASPSIQEGQGITLLEAQATAKPVVAFNVSAINEVVKNNETGLLVKPSSLELANAISRLLSNPSLREKLGRSGREFVRENFSWDILAQKMFQVYSEVSERI
jgi:glycosyltransferase involved in cell wall biosynthesis